MKAIYPYDTTPFIQISIEEVVKTLLIAIVLVFLVMYLFLQNLRATFIPTIAVPVVLLGTFGILFAAGYSINVLTLFAMVLAIGLLVDDAIVVIENVERVMAEEGLSPREATRKSMDQITGRAGGHCAGSFRRAFADGVFSRLDWRYLPPIFDHHGLGDGALGARGAFLHAGVVRHDPWPRWKKGITEKKKRLLRFVQSHASGRANRSVRKRRERRARVSRGFS